MHVGHVSWRVDTDRRHNIDMHVLDDSIVGTDMDRKRPGQVRGGARIGIEKKTSISTYLGSTRHNSIYGGA